MCRMEYMFVIIVHDVNPEGAVAGLDVASHDGIDPFSGGVPHHIQHLAKGGHHKGVRVQGCRGVRV